MKKPTKLKPIIRWVLKSNPNTEPSIPHVTPDEKYTRKSVKAKE
jgi:hypothetical protein